MQPISVRILCIKDIKTPVCLRKYSVDSSLSNTSEKLWTRNVVLFTFAISGMSGIFMRGQCFDKYLKLKRCLFVLQI